MRQGGSEFHTTGTSLRSLSHRNLDPDELPARQRGHLLPGRRRAEMAWKGNQPARSRRRVDEMLRLKR
jgi:hypothetical protein